MNTRSTQQSSHIDSLPTEILLEVFSYLLPIHLYETVSKVCTNWKVICGDPCLYKTLVFRGSEVSTDTAVNLLKVAPLFEALTLIDMDDMDSILEEVGQHNYKIRSLVLEKVCSSSSEHFMLKQECMIRIIQHCTELRKLIFRGCYVHGNEFYEILCNQCYHLKTLHLDEGENYASMPVVHLANSCFDLEDLQIIQMLDDTHELTPISSNDIMALCNRFQKTLRSFRLQIGCWTPELFSALQKCERLETLGIISPVWIDESVVAISSIPSLRRLELKNLGVEEEILIQLFSSGGLTNLVSLELRSNDITNSIAEAIGDHLKHLQVLTLFGTDSSGMFVSDLTSTGLEGIINGCSRLLELNLYHLQYTIKKALLVTPDYLPGLKKLSFFPYKDLLENEIMLDETRKTVDQIKTSMPDLQLEFETFHSFDLTELVQRNLF